jgi:hypothetical protein
VLSEGLAGVRPLWAYTVTTDPGPDGQQNFPPPLNRQALGTVLAIGPGATAAGRERAVDKRFQGIDISRNSVQREAVVLMILNQTHGFGGDSLSEPLAARSYGAIWCLVHLRRTLWPDLREDGGFINDVRRRESRLGKPRRSRTEVIANVAAPCS